MQQYLAERGPEHADALWQVEHPPVFTLGRNARPEHLRTPGAIPVIRVDRGGQVTWHGPGQLISYLLLDLRRHNLGVRSLVTTLEAAVIATLADFGVHGFCRRDAPGVYVQLPGEPHEAKIAALGLRIRDGFSMHGLALNVNPQLGDFQRMDPCGYPGLRTTSLQALGIPASLGSVSQRLEHHLAAQLHAHIKPQNNLPAALLRTLARPI